MEKVAKVKDLKDKLCVSAKGIALALYNVKGKIYCIENKCAHIGGPLCQGNVDGYIVTCPWHGSKYDIRDGSLKGGPALKGVKSHKVKIDGEDILVDI